MALTRQEMERIITEERGSVLVNGRIISKVSDLPSDADLAGNDPDRRAAVADSLQAQIAALQAQLATLQGQQPAGGEQAPQDDLGGLPDGLAERLRAGGFTTRQQVRDADDERLLAIEGVGDVTLKKIRDEVK